MNLAQTTFRGSVFQSDNNKQMQKLIEELTKQLAARDDEIALQYTLNR